MKVKSNIKPMQQRMTAMQTLILPIMMMIAKRDAVKMVERFQKNVRDNSLGLKKLKKNTIGRKQRIGLERPEVPLYGRGDSQKKNSYINMMRLRKVKKGWRVAPSRAKHWSGKLKLSDLYKIHEFGCITGVKKDGNLIRIPPRPAAWKSYEQAAKERKENLKRKDLKAAMAVYIKTGKRNLMDNIAAAEEKGLAKYGWMEGE